MGKKKPYQSVIQNLRAALVTLLLNQEAMNMNTTLVINNMKNYQPSLI
jgi:hypothetical protein